MRRVKVLLVSLVLIFVAFLFVNTDGSVACASETTEVSYVDAKKDFISEKISITEAIPSASTSGYEDWLFAGWYTDQKCTSENAIKEISNKIGENAWAKFVPSDLLKVKVQFKNGTEGSDKTNMRLVSSVDTADYSKIGFYIEYHTSVDADSDGKEDLVTKTFSSSTVYNKIIASAESGVDYEYNAKVVDSKSLAFITATITNIPSDRYNNNFVIKAFWETPDGTRVYGQSRYVQVRDSYNNLVNIPVKAESASALESLTIQETGVEIKERRYHDGEAYGALMVEVKDTARAELSALTKYTVMSGEDTVATEYYRNLLSALGAVTNNVPKGDRTWYETISDEDEFVIVTAADLYGLSEIVNNAEKNTDKRFSKKTIYLGADIVINEGDAKQWKTTPPLYKWTPIGMNSTNGFMGVFDGQGKTIKGLYSKDDSGTTAEYQGLFGYASNDSTIRNFELRGSYFESVANYGWLSGSRYYALLGSVVGQLCGNMDTVYSDAIVVSGNSHVGGLVGRVNPGKTGNHTIENCWFDGSVTYNTDNIIDNYECVGGIVGQLVQGNTTILNCLNSGNISYYYATNTGNYQNLAVGGILGGVSSAHSTTTNRTFRIEDTMNVGNIVVQCSVENEDGTYSDYSGKIGSIYGCNNGQATLDNVHITIESNSSAAKDDSKGTQNVVTKTVRLSKSKFNGHYGYENAKTLGVYDAETNPTGKWVVRETNSDIAKGCPALKSFCDEYIDVSWYYDTRDYSAGNKTFTISTAEELYGLSDISQHDNFSTDTIKLDANIKLNNGEASAWYAGTKTPPTREFTPIGDKDNAFAGTFEGQGKKISGVYVVSEAEHIGLFAYVTGTVKDFSLTNSYINSTSTATAGTVGKGSIAGCAVGATFEDIYSDAYVKSVARNSGGFVGLVSGSGKTTNITNCWFAGEVKNTGTVQYVAGLVAMLDKGTLRMTDCLFTGDVDSARNSGNGYVGGLVGGVYAGSGVTDVQCYLTDCVSNGTVTTKKTTGAVGSVVGAISSSSGNTGAVHSYVNNVYSATTVTSGADLNTTYSFAGFGYPSYEKNAIDGSPLLLTDAELKDNNAYTYTQLTFRGSNEDTDNTGAWVATTKGPELYDFSTTKTTSKFKGVEKVNTDWFCDTVRFNNGSQTVTGFTINNASDFRGLAVIVNNLTENFSGCTVSINESTDVIDLNEGWMAEVNENGEIVTEAPNAWMPIGMSNQGGADRFQGTFNGNGCTIKGVYIESKDNFVGLFGYCGETGIIRNFSLENSYFNLYNQSGAVVGGSQGTVQDVYVKDDVTIVSERENIGGIVGQLLTNNKQGISNSWFDGTMIAGDGEKSYHIGGIVGNVGAGNATNKKHITNCLFTGTIISNKAEDAHVGGILGSAYSASNNKTAAVEISKCLSAGTVQVATTEATVGAVAGSVLNHGTGTTTVVIEDVYYVDVPVDSTNTAIEVTGAALGCGSNSADADNCALTGAAQQLTIDKLTGAEASKYTELDLASKEYNQEGVWALKSDGVPELNFFVDPDVDTNEGVQTLAKGWYYNNFTYNSDGAVVTTITTTTTTKDDEGNDVTNTVTNPKTYTISDDDDMFGLADLVNTDGNTFVGLKLILANDIEFNNVTTGNEAAGWAKTDNDPTTKWTPIGTTASKFRGIFDGQNKTISGIYATTATRNTSSKCNGTGLFGNIDGATIQNLRIENSYFAYTATQSIDAEPTYDESKKIYSYGYTNVYASIGSIVGVAHDNCIMKNVYSDAIISSTGRCNGGLVGSAEGSAKTETSVDMESCWFAGDMDVTYMGTNTLTGGLIGRVNKGKADIDTTLYTGNIVVNYSTAAATSTNNSAIGGLIGCDVKDNGYVNIKDSVAEGTIRFAWKDYNAKYFTSTMKTLRIGDIIGTLYNTSSNTDGTVLAATDIVSYNVATNKETKVDTTYGYSSGTENNLSEISTHSSDDLIALGATSSTSLAFTRAEGDTTSPIWLARKTTVPVPETMADVVEDEIMASRIMTPDTTWYGDGKAIEYTITTAEQLYGLAKLSQTNSFKGQTIYLGGNITINSGDVEDWNKTSTYLWNPIGRDTSAARFAGTFDGQGYSISGIHAESGETYLALFAATAMQTYNDVNKDDIGVIKNLNVTNSYFKQLGDKYVGSIVGDLNSVLDQVYSDAIIESAGLQTGGIAARANGRTYKISTTETDSETGESTTVTTTYRYTSTFNNCWFDGTINVTDIVNDGYYVGGITGVGVQGTANYTNCLFTGEINAPKTVNSLYVGGLCGGLMPQKAYPASGYAEGTQTTANVKSTIAAGDITSPIGENTYVGSLIGRVRYDSTNKNTSYVNLNNVFATTPAWNQHSNAVVTGLAVQSANKDRLMGYGIQESGHALDFANNIWTLRTNDVPVLTYFKDNVENQATLITSPNATTMAQEIGLNYWKDNATITDAKASGSGNYLVTYNTSAQKTYEGYIAKLQELQFEAWATNEASDMDEDGIIESTYYKEATGTTGEWVLNITYTEADSTIYISINTDTSALAKTLKSDAANNPLANAGGENPISLSMVELVNTSRYGNGFVFQLPNGHFIVNDGGMTSDAEGLVEYLKELAGTKEDETQNPVYIDAWILTHYHNDHAGAIQKFYSTPALREGIYLNAVYASEPSLYGLTSWSENHAGTVDNALRGAKSLTKSETDFSRPDVYQLHMGQRYYFNGITMDVIDTQEQHHTDTWDDYSDPDKFNATSTNCLYSFTDSNNVQKKVLIGGDSTNVNMQYIMNVYGKNYTTYNHDSQAYGGKSQTLSNVSVFVAYHHGKNTTATYHDYNGADIIANASNEYIALGTATKEWADYLLKNPNNADADNYKFDAVLFPYHQVFDTVKGQHTKTYTVWGREYTFKLYEGDDGSRVFPYNMTEINQYFKDNAKAYYTYGYEDAFAATNDSSHGTVKIVFDGQNTATVAPRKAKVDGETGETQ